MLWLHLPRELAEDLAARVAVLSSFCPSDRPCSVSWSIFLVLLCTLCMCVRARSGRICVNFFQYIYVSCYSITMATKLTFFLLHSVLKGFYFRPLTSLLVSASHSPLQEERSYFSFKKFHSLCGKDLAPYRALKGRSKKEIILCFWHFLTAQSIAL